MGALLANGDRTALIRVDTVRDTGSTGSGDGAGEVQTAVAHGGVGGGRVDHGQVRARLRQCGSRDRSGKYGRRIHGFQASLLTTVANPCR